MANLNDLREACKALDGLVLPFLAAVIILYWLLHDGHAQRRIEENQKTMQGDITSLAKSMSRFEEILSRLDPQAKQKVVEAVNGRNIHPTIEANHEAMQKAKQESR